MSGYKDGRGREKGDRKSGDVGLEMCLETGEKEVERRKRERKMLGRPGIDRRKRHMDGSRRKKKQKKIE